MASEFEGPFECIWENSEIYKRFSVPLKKEVIKIDKDGKKSVETISYKIKFTDSMTFMATSLTKLVDNYSLKYESVKNNLIKYKCLSWNKNYSEKLKEELRNKFKNTFTFSKNDISKFMLLLRKDVYPYDYMNDWERFNEIALPEKEKLYNNLNMEGSL